MGSDLSTNGTATPLSCVRSRKEAPRDEPKAAASGDAAAWVDSATITLPVRTPALCPALATRAPPPPPQPQPRRAKRSDGGDGDDDATAVKDRPGRRTTRTAAADAAATTAAAIAAAATADVAAEEERNRQWAFLVAWAKGTEGFADGLASDPNETASIRGEATLAVPGLPRPLLVHTHKHSQMETGGFVWEGGECLVRWLCSRDAATTTASAGAGGAAAGGNGGGVPPMASIGSVLELGAGTGVCSVAAAMLGAHAPHAGMPANMRVVATDGDPHACAQCVANARRNGVDGVVRTQRLLWGERATLQQTLALFDDGDGVIDSGGGSANGGGGGGGGGGGAEGRGGGGAGMGGGGGPELVIAADVVYGRCLDELDGTLRAIVRSTRCRWVVLSWRVRRHQEEEFLHRLDDLGRVHTAWRATVHSKWSEGRGATLVWPGEEEAAEAVAAGKAGGGGDGGSGGGSSDEDDDEAPERTPAEVGVSVLEVDATRPGVRAEPGWRPPIHLRTLAIAARRRKSRTK